MCVKEGEELPSWPEDEDSWPMMPGGVLDDDGNFVMQLRFNFDLAVN